ncbi:hypothetical protein LTR83_010551, partial [Exophiala xenobiotica]
QKLHPADKTLVQNGIQIPKDILQDLYKGINHRQQAANSFAKLGGLTMVITT